MLQFPQQNCKKTKFVKMKCVLSSVRKGNKTHDGVKWLCEQQQQHNNIFFSDIKYTNITPPANSKANQGRWCVDG